MFFPLQLLDFVSIHIIIKFSMGEILENKTFVHLQFIIQLIMNLIWDRIWGR